MERRPSEQSNTPYALKQTWYLDYEILCLEQPHLIFVFDPNEETQYYLSLTPSEYAILLQFFRSPEEETVPFQEFLPANSPLEPRRIFLSPLQRHVCRLRKKLPPRWKIACEPGFGYRLRIIKAPARPDPSSVW